MSMSFDEKGAAKNAFISTSKINTVIIFKASPLDTIQSDHVGWLEVENRSSCIHYRSNLLLVPGHYSTGCNKESQRNQENEHAKDRWVWLDE